MHTHTEHIEICPSVYAVELKWKSILIWLDWMLPRVGWRLGAGVPA